MRDEPPRAVNKDEMGCAGGVTAHISFISLQLTIPALQKSEIGIFRTWQTMLESIAP